MMKTHKRLMLSAAILSAGLLVSGAVARPVAAATTTCRSDPLVALSDGTTIQISDSISADASSVNQVNYYVHAPAGVKITSITYTGGQFAGKEVVTLYNDQTPGNYEAGTQVTATGKNIPVTMTSNVTSMGTKSASGYNGQTLITSY